MFGKQVGARRYSERTRQVLFLARAKAGIRGSPAMEIGDLIWGLVVEDQMGFAQALSLTPEFSVGSLRSVPTVQPAPRFLAASASERILQQLESALKCSSPNPPEAEVRMSSAVKQTLGLARTLLQENRGHSVLTPLHLLAAAVASPDRCAAILRAEGVTQEQVIRQLHKRKR